MSSSDSVDHQKMQQQINRLIISGSKYSASGDFAKATECYAELLDLESQNASHYVLLAKCLYQLGLQKNDMFGGGQDESDGDDDNEGAGLDDDEDADADDGFESYSENELDQDKLALNQKFFQFDHEEEEEEEETTYSSSESDNSDDNMMPNQDNDDKDIVKSELQISELDPETPHPSETNRFQDYLKGDVFENAMELLFRARIIYTESPSYSLPPASTTSASTQTTTFPSSLTASSTSTSTSLSSLNSRSLKKEVQLKLVEIHDLLGDIDQELEDFAQSINDYEEAIRYYRDATMIENAEEIINIYLKMAESLRWLDSTDKNITKEKHKIYLQQILDLIQKRIESGESVDLEEDNQRIERLKEDLDVLEKGKVNIKEKILTQSSMMEALLQQAMSKTQRKKINDLSNMVKKKKVRK